MNDIYKKKQLMEPVLLDDLIKETTHQAVKIKAQYEVYKDFNQRNPWIINEMIQNIKMSQSYDPTAQDLSFDKILSFKSEYFIDSYSKIYKQLIKRNPKLVPSDKDIILFYAIEEGLYKQQQEAGYQLGDKDDLGRIVTGSDLVLNSIKIDMNEFLGLYYSANN